MVYFFYFLRSNKGAFLISFGSSLVLAAFFRPVLRFASRYIHSFRYFDNADDKIRAGGIWLLWAIELLLAGFFLISWLLDKDDGPAKEKGCLLEADKSCVPVFVVYYILFTFLGTRFNYLNRFGIYFLPFIIPLFLNFGRVIGEKSAVYGKLYRIGLMAGFFGYFMLSIGADQYQYAFGW